MYSALAGYVEPGDDIADAVRRETREEVGLEVGEVQLLGSQPWPFPHSLMLGCLAHAKPAELVIDRGEVQDARWFTRKDAEAMLAGTHPEELWLPGPQAIAHHLVKAFLAG
jgi:NAD+ diphosphatase